MSYNDNVGDNDRLLVMRCNDGDSKRQNNVNRAH